MSNPNSNSTMAFLLLYILEKEYGEHLSMYGNGDLRHAIRDTLDELAFERIDDQFAAHAEKTFDPSNAISLIDTRDFAEDVIRIIPPNRPSVGRAHKMLGHVCVQQGDQKSGQEHFEKAIVIFEQHGMTSYLHDTQTSLRDLLS